MNVEVCLRIALVGYLAGTLGYMLLAVFARPVLQTLAGLITWFAFSMHCLVLVHHIWMTHRVPFSNMYETLLFFSWLLVLMSMWADSRYRIPIIGTFTLPIVFLLLAATSLIETDLGPLMPSLRSNWLLIHVSTCSLAYTAFAVAFASSALFLILARLARAGVRGGGRLDSRLELLDALTYRMITIGFPFLTLGIVTGSIWADLSWGTYWSWDPKETWSLVTWLVYGICLHLRHVSDLRGGWAAVASVVGFASVACTYFGVNYFFATLHAYA